jgi:hypothetical protein
MTNMSSRIAGTAASAVHGQAKLRVALIGGATALAIHLCTAPACAADPPRLPNFDSDKFCRDLRVPILSIYPEVVYRMCMTQEQLGQDHLRAILVQIDPDLMMHCQLIVTQHVPGGSYWLFDSCVRHP